MIGYLSRFEPEAVEALQVLVGVLRSPDRLALVLQAAGSTVLERTGRILARRLAL